MYINELVKEHLTEDDIKILKHLQAIDNLFKKGNINIEELFADNGHLLATIRYKGYEYEIEDFYHITCDGGDVDKYGKNGILSYNELIDELEKDMEG